MYVVAPSAGACKNVVIGDFLWDKKAPYIRSRRSLSQVPESALRCRLPDSSSGAASTTQLSVYCFSSRVATIFTPSKRPGSDPRRLRSKPECDLPQPSLMNDSERLSRLRHDLSNPLSALLAETQLLLLNEAQIDAEILTGLREIEALAIRMRTMLREL